MIFHVLGICTSKVPGGTLIVGREYQNMILKNTYIRSVTYSTTTYGNVGMNSVGTLLSGISMQFSDFNSPWFGTDCKIGKSRDRNNYKNKFNRPI